MRRIIPYTKILDVTYIALRNQKYDTEEIKGEYGYSRFFKKQWDNREGFINIEHDCVVWPGAIQELENCLEPWCAYDYSSDSNWALQQEQGILHSIPLGCMKITKEFMEKLLDVWNEDVDWYRCDVHLFQKASEVGIKIHQHFPGIVNANPELIKLCIVNQ